MEKEESLQQKILEQLDFQLEKTIKKWSIPSTILQVKSIDKNLNLKAKTVKFSGKNIRVKLHDLVSDNGFLGVTLKSKVTTRDRSIWPHQN